MDHKVAIQNIREELRHYITENGIKSLVIGVSGGIDSALCIALAKPVCEELNIPLMGRSLPAYTNKSDEVSRAKLIGEAFCTDFMEEPINAYHNCLSWINRADEKNHLYPNNIDWAIRNGNIQARIRMTYLYNLASIHEGMVLSTDNYTEYLLGFWTLHGDVGDFGMIQELWKTEVYDMTEWLAENEYVKDEAARFALRLCMDALATDGLGVTETGDLGQILPGWKGSSRDGYKEVDRILSIWTSLHELEPTQKTLLSLQLESHPVVKRHTSSEFKRKNPYNIKRKNILKNG